MATYEEIIQRKSNQLQQQEIRGPSTVKSSIDHGTSAKASTGESLYMEAHERNEKFRQAQQQAIDEVKVNANRQKIDMNSQRMVLQRKEKRLQEYLNQCSQGNDVTFQGLVELLVLIGMVQDDPALHIKYQRAQESLINNLWRLVETKASERAHSFVVFNSLMVLLETQLTHQQTKELLSEVLRQQSLCEEFEPVNADIESLIIDFKVLLERNRNLVEQSLGKKQVKVAQTSSYSFHPKICEKSKDLDHRSQQPIPRFESLFAQAKDLEAKRKKQQELQPEVDPECVFRPQTNKRRTTQDQKDTFTRLYSLAGQVQAHKEELKEYYQSQDEDKIMNECTFKPQFCPQKPLKQISEVKGMETAIERQEKARKLHHDKENFYQAKQQKANERSTHRLTIPEPFSQRTSIKVDKKVLVNVDVRISRHKTVRIALHENDDPKQVAVNFARIYSLNSGMLATLEEMLAGYLKQFQEL